MKFRRKVATVERFPLFIAVAAAGCSYLEGTEVERASVPGWEVCVPCKLVLVFIFSPCVCFLFPGGEFPWSPAWGWSDTCWQSGKTFPKPEGSRLRMYMKYFPSLEWRFLTVSLQHFKNQVFSKCRSMSQPLYQQVAFKKCSGQPWLT